MAASVIVDAGFLVALLTDRDSNNTWAQQIAQQHSPPWMTCEAVIAETFYLLGPNGAHTFSTLLKRQAVTPSFHLADSMDAVLTLMQKHADVPMSVADACLVRMTELLPQPILLTTDADFRFYRRHSRRTIPCLLPD
jgi:predicted nucleic acid-binding protein